MSEHTWDADTNACKHCGATPWAINEGYRAIECNPGENITGFTHRQRKRGWEKGKIVVEAFPEQPA